MKQSLFIAIVATFCQCNYLGRYETVLPAHVAIQVNEETGLITDKELINPGNIYVPSGNRLVVFNLMGDTLNVKGNAVTKDSISVVYSLNFVYSFQKSQIVEFYEKHGIMYMEVFIDPEMRNLVRNYIGGTNIDDLERRMEDDILDLTKRFLSDSHLIFLSMNHFEYSRSD